MTKKTRRRFSDEFKADAVSLVIDQGIGYDIEPAVGPVTSEAGG